MVGETGFAYFIRSHHAHSLRKLPSLHSENHPDFLPCIEYSLWLYSTHVVRSLQILSCQKSRGPTVLYFFEWSGRQDLNLRPSAPKADALPDCATPRSIQEYIILQTLSDTINTKILFCQKI